MTAKLSGLKTYSLCIIAILAAWLSYWADELEKKEVVAATIAALTAASMRSGMRVEADKNVEKTAAKTAEKIEETLK